MAGVDDIAASSIADVSGKETVERWPPRAGTTV